MVVNWRIHLSDSLSLMTEEEGSSQQQQPILLSNCHPLAYGKVWSSLGLPKSMLWVPRLCGGYRLPKRYNRQTKGQHCHPFLAKDSGIEIIVLTQLNQVRHLRVIALKNQQLGLGGRWPLHLGEPAHEHLSPARWSSLLTGYR